MSERSKEPDGGDSSICLFHLVWAPLGLHVFEEFLSSYLEHPVGLPHRLHILFNGFASKDDIAPYHALLSQIPHDFTVLDRPVQDITAYLEGAKHVDSDYVCFLNSYAVVLVPGWLENLYRFASLESVGLVGATCSYESHLTRAHREHPVPTLKFGRKFIKWPWTLARWIKQTIRRKMIIDSHDANFPHFPNPHLRSNAFMLRRDLLLSLDFGDLTSKSDAFRFESGKTGLTRQILRAGLDVLVIGRDGKGYSIEEWEGSRTFRTGDQSNLLISDNHTRAYAEGSPEDRRVMADWAWRGEPRETELAQSESILESDSPTGH